MENVKATDFTLPDHSEKMVSLSDFSHKWKVVYFYPKDNTSGCTKEAVDFSEIIDEFKDLNAEVIGISPDSTASHKKFIEKYDLSVILLSDVSKSVLKAYEAWGIKKNYGKEYEGVIRSTFLLSPDNMIVKHWKNVRVRSKRKTGEVKHAEIVRDFLKEII